MSYATYIQWVKGKMLTCVASSSALRRLCLFLSSVFRCAPVRRWYYRLRAWNARFIVHVVSYVKCR